VGLTCNGGVVLLDVLVLAAGVVVTGSLFGGGSLRPPFCGRSRE
jgi:hypothetical protein